MADTAAAEIEYFNTLLIIIGQKVASLRKQEPGHELLRFANPALELEEWPDELRSEFLERFGNGPDTTHVQVWTKYLMALKTALGVGCEL